ncbi:MAG TPA: hypothetical protein VIG25_04780 [Pyrinomonadaceae bacterium]|jgi:hypothetical protein
MYINTLSEAGSTCATFANSAERDITENDAGQVLTILGGPSPWRQYLQANLNSNRRDLPAKPIRICDPGEFVTGYRRIFRQAPDPDAQGFVDRRNAMIILKEFPERNFGKSKLGLALHEAVHLFSHPPGRSNLIRGTVFNLLQHGLLEGLTQMITEDILTEQCISPMRERWRAYEAFTPVARRFVASFSPRIVGDAYFLGRINPLVNLIHIKWTDNAFHRLRELVNQKQTPAALQMIDRLNRPREFQQVFR